MNLFTDPVNVVHNEAVAACLLEPEFQALLEQERRAHEVFMGATVGILFHARAWGVEHEKVWDYIARAAERVSAVVNAKAALDAAGYPFGTPRIEIRPEHWHLIEALDAAQEAARA